MSREIKYRAWDKINKHFIDFYGDYYAMSPEGDLLLFSSSCGEIEFEVIYNVEISLFTGLKDRNGKEIYEGDILKITCNFEFRKGVEIDKVVWWENGAWSCNDWCLYELINNSKEGKQDFGVIGNIYENPEMIQS